MTYSIPSSRASFISAKVSDSDGKRPRLAINFRRLTTLDRYMISELGGPFAFGFTVFTLILTATQMIAVGKLVSDEHAPLWAALEFFLWEQPQYLLKVIPMAMLLGVLLALGRLSGESEITAMKAGGISLLRIVAPLLVIGLIASFIVLVLQEELVPLANDQAAYVREAVIKKLSPFTSNLNFNIPLPGGGSQLTRAASLDPTTQTLMHVTIIQYDKENRFVQIIKSDKAKYIAPTWSFADAIIYRFNPDGSLSAVSTDPRLRVDIGAPPSEMAKRAVLSNPEEMSRAQIKEQLDSGQLSPLQENQFRQSYDAKLALPFASFVFALIAVPFGLRRARGGGTSLGFGLALPIVFAYYVIVTIFGSIGELGGPAAFIAAWTPNLLFTAIGLWLLRRASAV